jgi:hypothetical protein
MPQNRKGLTNAAFADFSYSTEEFVCGVEIMSGKMQGEVVLPVPTRYDNASCLSACASALLMLHVSAHVSARLYLPYGK